jgi:hypothetical protein
MANSDKDILITPNTGAVNRPNIRFNGADNTPLNLFVQDSGALTIEGTAGQLFSVADGMSGTIFAVNDITGMPSIDVRDTGDIRLAPFSGRVAIGKTSAAYNLDVGGTVNASTYYQNGLPVGGMTLIASGAVPTGVSTFLIAAIPQTFRDIRLILRNVFWTSNGSQMFIRFNNNGSGSLHYNNQWANGNGNNFSYNDTQMTVSGGTWSSINYGYTVIDFEDYSNTTTYKMAISRSNHTSTNGEGWIISWNNVGWFRSTASVSSIGVFTSGGTFSGGTWQLYGIR